MPTHSSPWAVLLFKWADKAEEPTPRDYYEQLFTLAGNGTNNLVALFHDMSHGHIDISGSQVFPKTGWYTLDAKSTDYQTWGNGRGGKLIALAKQEAIAADPSIDGFAGIAIMMNTPASNENFAFSMGPTDPMVVACSNTPPEVTTLAEELAHGYGIDHGRRDGSLQDYQDPWDFLTAWAQPFYPAVDPNYGHVGPGLNAWNMRFRGWLTEQRVCTAPDGADCDVELRPLHRVDLPGWLAVNVGEYLVEFRFKERWDAGIPRSAILIHRFEQTWEVEDGALVEENHSYLMSGKNGARDMVVGDVFEVGYPAQGLFGYARVEVVAIDEPGQSATVRVGYREPLRPLVIDALAAMRPLGPSGSGIWMTPGGRIIRIPPGDPLFLVLKGLEAYWSADTVSERGLANTVRRNALQDIARQVNAVLKGMEPRMLVPGGSSTKLRVPSRGREGQLGEEKQSQ